MFENKLGWEKWLKDGDQYMRAAGLNKEKSVFNNSIRYNLLSMSLEGYVMAILDFHGTLPFNHTFRDLMDGLERTVTLDAGLKERVLRYENIQSICSIEKYHRKAPEDEEIQALGSAVCEIGEMAHQICLAAAQTV